MRALDEVAEAVRRARGSRQRPVLTPFGLEAQFDYPLTAREWNVIRDHLACPLPALEFVQGHWFLPDGFETIWDLVDHVIHFRPGLERPTERTETTWREAQIFAGVKIELIGALSIDPQLVTRDARLKHDLGAE
jgi:hypothetical protein